MTQIKKSSSPNYEDVLNLVKQLSFEEKLKLSKELEKEAINNKLTELLEALHTEELSLDTIEETVEAVRTEMYYEKF